MTIDLGALKDALAKATPGPWIAKAWDTPYKIGVYAADGADYKTCTPIAMGRAKAPDKKLLDELHLIAYEREQVPIVEANAAAIVALHNAAPAMIATIQAQAERVRVLEGLLADVRDGHGCQPGYINGLTLQRVAAALGDKS